MFLFPSCSGSPHQAVGLSGTRRRRSVATQADETNMPSKAAPPFGPGSLVEPLLQDARRPSPSRRNYRAAAVILIMGVAGGVLYLFNAVPMPQYFTLEAAVPAPPTLPFGKCAGMDYSTFPPTAYELCCPSTTLCVKYSPFFGMCTPAPAPPAMPPPASPPALPSAPELEPGSGAYEGAEE